jgi:1,2-diacylglycerol-3-alpha-glucose alpha-1,2-glucosyltransferase
MRLQICSFFPSYEETEGIVILEALASKQQVLVRDIPVYKGWLKDKENCYMGTSNVEFAELISGLVERQLPNTRAQGYLVAKEKSIEQIGHELKKIYEKVLLQDQKKTDGHLYHENTR